jgi:hypothetical protein
VHERDLELKVLTAALDRAVGSAEAEAQRALRLVGEAEE